MGTMQLILIPDEVKPRGSPSQSQETDICKLHQYNFGEHIDEGDFNALGGHSGPACCPFMQDISGFETLRVILIISLDII